MRIDKCTQFTRGGVITVMEKVQYFSNRNKYSIGYPSNDSTQSTTTFKRTNRERQ